MTPFGAALAFTLQADVEGGYSNHPLDRGGSTNHGVTQREYDAWRTTTGKPRQNVRFMTADELYAICRDDYWLPAGCDQYPDQLAIAVFDMAYNSGPLNAKRTLQKALGFTGDDVDGVIGVKTLKAAKETPDATQRFLIARGKFIQEVILTRPDQVVFLAGWIKRMVLLAARTA